MIFRRILRTSGERYTVITRRTSSSVFLRADSIVLPLVTSVRGAEISLLPRRSLRNSTRTKGISFCSKLCRMRCAERTGYPFWEGFFWRLCQLLINRITTRRGLFLDQAIMVIRDSFSVEESLYGTKIIGAGELGKNTIAKVVCPCDDLTRNRRPVFFHMKDN